ncbi:MAG: hypothetical protein JRJ39_00275 [Deltaproteobacteria bacterium]|nr:hypothetical protein [Deltaproteobacteria bacterium]
MARVALSGKDTTKINNRILSDLVDGDCTVLTFPNDLVTAKAGKNGNVVYGFNYPGELAEVSIRILKGSADDKFLNELLAIMKNDPPSFVLMSGEFVKNIGDGTGAITTEIYIMSGGVFKKNPEAKENAEGDTEQSISVYNFIFGKAPRTIG